MLTSAEKMDWTLSRRTLTSYGRRSAGSTYTSTWIFSTLAKEHPLPLKLYGENTGQGSREAMDFSASQMRRHGLMGMAWYREAELFSGRYATLEDYERTIEASERAGK